jgi:hypothetical protein
LNHFHTYEFTSLLQVTSTNDLIINTIWLLIAWLVPQLNTSTLFFTLAMVPRSSSHHLPFTFAQSPEAFSLLSSPYQAILKSHHIKHLLKYYFFIIVILTWISSRYECWDQSSFSLTHIETYMYQHQYGQANSRFLKSHSFWLDTPNTHFNILSSYF